MKLSILLTLGLLLVLSIAKEKAQVSPANETKPAKIDVVVPAVDALAPVLFSSHALL